MRTFCVLPAILRTTILNQKLFLKSTILKVKFFLKSMIFNGKVFVKRMIFNLNFFVLSGCEIIFFSSRQISNQIVTTCKLWNQVFYNELDFEQFT